MKDKERISLGNKTLEFISAPWVHWPDTILTYLPEDRILFTCDFLGSHLATSDLYALDEALVYESAKRYYAEIMMPFRQNILRHLEQDKGPQHRYHRPQPRTPAQQAGVHPERLRRLGIRRRQE